MTAWAELVQHDAAEQQQHEDDAAQEALALAGGDRAEPEQQQHEGEVDADRDSEQGSDPHRPGAARLGRHPLRPFRGFPGFHAAVSSLPAADLAAVLLLEPGLERCEIVEDRGGVHRGLAVSAESASGQGFEAPISIIFSIRSPAAFEP